MYFDDLYCALIRNLKLRVLNGEITERQLARLAGVSQPHIHNVLKGAKVLSNCLCDQVLKTLGMSILDLMDPVPLAAWVREHRAPERAHSFLRVLDGLIGPGQPWPTKVSGSLPFPITAKELSKQGYPVAARVADDPRMHPVFSGGDWVILDQSDRARRELDESSYYLLKMGGQPLIRRIRILGGTPYAITEDAIRNPSAWERLDPDPAAMSRVVRAKVRFLPPGTDWWDSGDYLFPDARATSR
jgi:hypothetical protein